MASSIQVVETHRERHSTHQQRSAAFTLVELLVVIGIIALLISILLPSLNAARESARRTQCASNVRQIAIALLAYSSDNKGMLPAAGSGPNFPNPNEWLRWELEPLNTSRSLSTGGTISPLIATQGVGRFLGLRQSNVNVLRCPSDGTYEKREKTLGTQGDYCFSYVLNYLFSSDGAGYIYSDPVKYPPSVVKSYMCAKRVTQIRNSSNKVLVYDMDPRRTDDGFGRMWDLPTTAATYGYDIDRLSIVHDRQYNTKQDPLFLPGGTTLVKYLPNSGARGNAGYADGHVEYVTRKLVHSPGSAVADEGGYPRIVPAFDYRP
jgi:prepilin-type processing-associated H-X9-DG protein